MRQGFIKVAAVTPKIRVADPAYNTEEICRKLEEACGAGAKIIVCKENNKDIQQALLIFPIFFSHLFFYILPVILHILA